MKTDLIIDENHLKEIFRDSEECFLVLDKDKKILYLNNKAASLLGQPFSSTEIEHLFTFDICILNNNDIFNYNPLHEAVLIKENLKSEVLFQLNENEYKNFCLRSYKNSDNTIIILSDTSINQQFIEKERLLKEYEVKITELEANNKEFLQLQEQAQNLAIRTGLINRISNSIRESLDLEKIIEIALVEISQTLGIDKSYFAAFDEEQNLFILKNSWNLNQKDRELFRELNPVDDFGINQAFVAHKTSISSVMTDSETNNIQPRLITPVLYRDKILGILVFYHVNNKRIWHEEEITLIEGLTSQLASAINQAELFKTTLKQKNELEKAILRLKETQSQLVQSEKMASLGQLIAGVAHEINTPLGSVNSNNNIFSKCISKIITDIKDQDIVEIMEESINTSNEAIKRISSLVKSLKNFARLDEAEYQETDIHEGIKSTLTFINHEIKDRIEVIQEFEDIPLIKCYPDQLNQVFMNILINACQSIEKTGKIKIKTEKHDNNVLITISDTGKGIAKENINKIFDPGFTTKRSEMGTGLGLSICYKIIEKHNGKISVESTENQGTAFKITLPC